MTDENYTVNVIGDIAGQYKTFMALIAKMPKGRIVSVGDVVDRGPDSKESVEWFMNNKDHCMLRGNHEDFLIQCTRDNGVYEYSDWYDQGGLETLESFGGSIPPEVLAFLTTRKYFQKIKIKDKWYFASHAFAKKPDDLDLSTERKKMEFIWNRGKPVESEKYALQICGHNSHFGLRWFSDDNNQQYAVCIDSSASKVLTGISLPSRMIYQQEYLD